MGNWWGDSLTQWCNLTLAWRFWATKVCRQASKISKICLFGHLTGQATSQKANFGNFSRYSLIKLYQFLSKSRHIKLKTSHHMVNNAHNRVIGWRWRWLIYAQHNFLICKNVLRVFKSSHHCFWKFHKFHRKPTCVGVSFSKSCRPADLFHVCFSLYPIIHVITSNPIVCINISMGFWKLIDENVKKKPFFSKQTYLYIRVTGILKFYEMLFYTHNFVFFVFKKQSLCLHSSVYA